MNDTIDILTGTAATTTGVFSALASVGEIQTIFYSFLSIICALITIYNFARRVMKSYQAWKEKKITIAEVMRDFDETSKEVGEYLKSIKTVNKIKNESEDKHNDIK